MLEALLQPGFDHLPPKVQAELLAEWHGGRG